MGGRMSHNHDNSVLFSIEVIPIPKSCPLVNDNLIALSNPNIKG